MKVLFINENIGGHETVHIHLRRALARRAQEIGPGRPGFVDARFIDVPPPSMVARLLGARIPGAARLDLDLQPLRAQLARSAWVAGRLRKWLADVDVIHLYTHNAGLLSASRWRSVPTVVSLDTTNAQNAYRLPTRRPTRFTPLTVAATKPFERRVYEAAAAVVANSQWAAHSLREDYGLTQDRLIVLPFGISVPEPPPRSPRSSRPCAVFVGRSLERKGGNQLLRVHRERLADRLDLSLVTAERPQAQPGLTVRTDIGPGDERLWSILSQASMFVFPSAIDMAPNAVLEAMMAGLPVIARPVGAIPEMVVDGVTGMLIGPDDDDLAGAITHLLDNPDLRDRMARAARARALETYDAGRTTETLIKVLAAAADSGKPVDGRGVGSGRAVR